MTNLKLYDTFSYSILIFVSYRILVPFPNYECIVPDLDSTLYHIQMKSNVMASQTMYVFFIVGWVTRDYEYTVPHPDGIKCNGVSDSDSDSEDDAASTTSDSSQSMPKCKEKT